MNEVRRAKNTILFIDGVAHPGRSGRSRRGDRRLERAQAGPGARRIQCIGATTLDEYRKYIEKDSAWIAASRMVMGEPDDQGRNSRDPQRSARSLRAAPSRPDHRTTRWPRPSSCRAAISPAAACRQGDRRIDEAGARVRLKAMTRPPDLKEIDEEVEKLNKGKGRSGPPTRISKRQPPSAIRPTKLKKKKQTITATGAKNHARPWSGRPKK